MPFNFYLNLKELGIWPLIGKNVLVMNVLVMNVIGWVSILQEFPGPQLSLRLADDTTLIAESEEEELKSFLMKVKEQSEKALKKIRSWHLVPSLHGKQRWKSGKEWQILFSWASKSLQTVTTAMKLKGTFSLKEKFNKPRQHIKKQSLNLPTNAHIVKATVFPVVKCGCES